MNHPFQSDIAQDSIMVDLTTVKRRAPSKQSTHPKPSGGRGEALPSAPSPSSSSQKRRRIECTPPPYRKRSQRSEVVDSPQPKAPHQPAEQTGAMTTAVTTRRVPEKTPGALRDLPPPMTETQEALPAEGLSMESPPPVFALHSMSAGRPHPPCDEIAEKAWKSGTKAFFEFIDQRPLLTE